MVTLKEIIKDIFTTELENQQTDVENVDNSNEEANEPETPTYDEEAIKAVVRDEIKEILDEIKAQQVENRNKATINKEDLVKSDERTVDDIMKDMITSRFGSRLEKGENNG